jgi:acetyl esterase/lipase
VRSRLLALSLVPLLAASAGAAPDPTPEPPNPELMRSVVLRVPGMDRVRVRRDLVYERVDGIVLRADVYLPSDAGGKPPPVLVLQAGGGSDDTKEWEIYRSLGRLFAASGVAAVPFNHRLGYPKRRYEEGARDLNALLETLRRESGALGIDASRIAVAAFSGGGPMLSPLLRAGAPGVRCLLGFYPFLDTDHVQLDEAGVTREVAQRFSPRDAIAATRGEPLPFFVARAGRDQIPGVDESIDRFVADALRRNWPITLVNHPEGSHGFEHREDDARTREILRMAIAFVRLHLGVDG